MDNKSAAKQKLAVLLKEFQDLTHTGRAEGQAEATARTWVERFLNAFGWNSSDPDEVRQEYRIKGRAGKRLEDEEISHNRPDYCLIAHGQPVLFIDVKRFGANLATKDYVAYQVRSYGWSVGLKISYAFDFEELAIYDCRVKPTTRDEAEDKLLLFLRHTEYLEQFDKLWSAFGKEAIDSGSLATLVPDEKITSGIKTLDQDFEENLSLWRKELAKSIIRYGKMRDPVIVSAAAQRIIDRIIFLRMCEEFGLERMGSLSAMGTHEDGFWPLYLEEHEKRYGKVYDGILFPAAGEDDPTGVDAHLRDWWLKGRIFREITDKLYYPSPYRFDIMPLELLGGIYERFLGKRLRIIGAGAEDEYKPEYQRTKGAVYTPPWVVRRVVKNTLAPLTDGKDPDDILRLRLLDPACGSAGFLLGVYDHLESRILAWFKKHPRDKRCSSFVAENENGVCLAPDVVRDILNKCLYGVDIDAEAVEVARMSLALRFLERTAAFEGEPHLLLKGIGLNIRQGNALVGPDVVGLGIDAKEVIRETMPFDWRNKTTGFGEVMTAGGFDAVVGNPPYIEVKRYKEWMPAQYRYLKEGNGYETTAEGKTDIAMPFMERGVSLLKPGGRLGFIIQNRFFKTDYGESARAWLRRNKAIVEIEDFRDLQVFEGRTTYTAIVILEKDSPSIYYRTYASLDDAIARKPSVNSRLKWDALDDNVWSFDQPDLMEVHNELVRRHGTIGRRPQLQISVGLQTLYGKIYQFEPVEVSARTVIGRNAFGDTVNMEMAALRPLCRNRGFYPFRKNNVDAWVIFPYDVENGEAREIGWNEFKRRFPKTADYLKRRKGDILEAVETEKGANRWHLYRWPKNLAGQVGPKVLFPSTIEDTIATVDETGDIYQDNVRINSITFSGAAIVQLKSLACLFNSSVFSILARLKAGLSDSGWRQLNRQYAELVPFPSAITDNPEVVKKLSALADKITALQEESVGSEAEGARTGFRAALESLWDRLDEAVEEAYSLTKAQRKVLQKYPRRVNRFDLLTRQQIPDEED